MSELKSFRLTPGETVHFETPQQRATRPAKPKRITWLAVLNFVVLQWFGLRLARVKLPPGVIGYRVTRRVQAGELLTFSDVTGAGRCQWWTLLRWIWPLTGWWSDYRWIRRVR